MSKRGWATTLVGLSGIFLAATTLLAQDVVKSADGTQVLLKVQPDFTEIVRETQQVSHETGGIINMVWWLPEELWKAALAANPNSIPPQTKTFIQEMFLKVVHPYFIVGVSSGKVGPFGAITYRAEAEVRGLVQLTDNEGSIYKPLPEDKVEPSMLALLNAMKPTLARTAGAFGENIHFYVFPGSKNDGTRICDPLKEGACEVELGGRAFKWRLPLGSLLPKQKCPVCGETLSGAYKFCPYDGTKLVADLAGTVVVQTSPGTVRENRDAPWVRRTDTENPAPPQQAPAGSAMTPGQAIQESLQAAARGGYHPSGNGAGGGGDSDMEFNNHHPNFSTEAPTILSDTRGMDFGPYVARIVHIVRRNWYAVIPEPARLGEKGRVGVVFEILKDGSVPHERLVVSSGSEPLDHAAMDGIHASVPFPPLPQEFTGNHLVLQFIFIYNLTPQ